eukprot:COSAG06_NODE_1568_length_9074_cov_5.196212_2_plen_177_part_00
MPKDGGSKGGKKGGKKGRVTEREFGSSDKSSKSKGRGTFEQVGLVLQHTSVQFLLSAVLTQGSLAAFTTQRPAAWLSTAADILMVCLCHLHLVYRPHSCAACIAGPQNSGKCATRFAAHFDTSLPVEGCSVHRQCAPFVRLVCLPHPCAACLAGQQKSRQAVGVGREAAGSELQTV